MINPDNTVHSKSHNPKGIEKVDGRPDRIHTEKKNRKTGGVYERKKTREELAEEWEEVKEKSEKGVKKGGEKEGLEKSVSLFDLARNKPLKNSGNSVQEKLDAIADDVAEPTKGGSLFDLASQKPTEKKGSEVKTHPTVNFMAQEAPQSSQGAAPGEKVRAPAEVAHLQKIVDEIVEHLYQLEKSGETSLIIVINDPKSPLHKASIRVTEFDSAKGELNITIDNLKNEAKVLIEKQQGSLLTSLEQKGYQVHQFIATSALENPRFYPGAPGSQNAREKEPNKEQEQEHEHPKEQQE